jgi:hypothetical protein
MTKEIIISKQISPIVEKAESLKITNSKTMEQASNFRAKLKEEEKRLEEDKQKLTKPINDSLKAIRAKYKPAEEIISNTLGILNTKMSDYQMELIKKQRTEEEKIVKSIESGDVSIDEAVEKMNSLSEVKTSKATAFRPSYELVIKDSNLIPREYLIVDESAVKKALIAGVKVAGAELKEVMIPVNIFKK